MASFLWLEKTVAVCVDQVFAEVLPSALVAARNGRATSLAPTGGLMCRTAQAVLMRAGPAESTHRVLHVASWRCLGEAQDFTGRQAMDQGGVSAGCLVAQQRIQRLLLSLTGAGTRMSCSMAPLRSSSTGRMSPGIPLTQLVSSSQTTCSKATEAAAAAAAAAAAGASLGLQHCLSTVHAG